MQTKTSISTYLPALTKNNEWDLLISFYYLGINFKLHSLTYHCNQISISIQFIDWIYIYCIKTIQFRFSLNSRIASVSISCSQLNLMEWTLQLPSLSFNWTKILNSCCKNHSFVLAKNRIEINVYQLKNMKNQCFFVEKRGFFLQTDLYHQLFFSFLYVNVKDIKSTKIKLYKNTKNRLAKKKKTQMKIKLRINYEK